MVGMNMIRAILFDYMGVLVHDFHLLYAELAKTSGMKETEIKPVFSKHWQQLKTGAMTDPEFWDRMKDELGLTEDDVIRLSAFILKVLTARRDATEAIKKLSLQYSLYLLSNSCYGWSEVSFDNNGFRPFFKETFWSHRLGLAKPDKKIYLYALEHMPFTPDEILFVDDTLESVTIAKKFGMSTVHFKNWKDFFKKLDLL